MSYKMRQETIEAIGLAKAAELRNLKGALFEKSTADMVIDRYMESDYFKKNKDEYMPKSNDERHCAMIMLAEDLHNANAIDDKCFTNICDDMSLSNRFAVIGNMQSLNNEQYNRQIDIAMIDLLEEMRGEKPNVKRLIYSYAPEKKGDESWALSFVSAVESRFLDVAPLDASTSLQSCFDMNGLVTRDKLNDTIKSIEYASDDAHLDLDAFKKRLGVSDDVMLKDVPNHLFDRNGLDTWVMIPSDLPMNISVKVNSKNVTQAKNKIGLPKLGYNDVFLGSRNDELYVYHDGEKCPEVRKAKDALRYWEQFREKPKEREKVTDVPSVVYERNDKEMK